jgi:predicted XRE-type DNA-binding protein
MQRGSIILDIHGPIDQHRADPEEALARAELARRIGEIIQARRLTQVQAAEILGIEQPRVSNLMVGRLSGFSLERLLRFLTALDRDVEITIKPKNRHLLSVRYDLGPGCDRLGWECRRVAHDTSLSRLWAGNNSASARD